MRSKKTWSLVGLALRSASLPTRPMPKLLTELGPRRPGGRPGRIRMNTNTSRHLRFGSRRTTRRHRPSHPARHGGADSTPRRPPRSAPVHLPQTCVDRDGGDPGMARCRGLRAEPGRVVDRGSATGVTVLYLVYLRRQTQTEEKVRRRRMQRCAGAAQVENTRDREYDVVLSGCARPGAVVLETTRTRSSRTWRKAPRYGTTAGPGTCPGGGQ